MISPHSLFMVYLLLALLSSQTLAPPPINFVDEWVPTNDGYVHVTNYNNQLRIYPPSKNVPFPQRKDPDAWKPIETLWGCGGCLVIVAICGGFWWGVILLLIRLFS